MLNWILVGLLLLALVGIGALAMMIDSGIEDKHKTKFVYALFGLFGLIGVVFLMVEDKSAFVYGDWASEGKKGGKKAKQHADVTEADDGGVAEAEATKKAGGAAAAEGEGDKSKAQGSAAAEVPEGRDCDVCPPMVRLLGANTVIGTLFREAGQGGPILGPLQEVKLPAYSIGRTEITVAQFEAFVKDTGYKPANSCRIGKDVRDGASFRAPGFEQGPDHPVVCVSWYDAAAYAEWLTRKTGRQYDVANEVEWEHAARSRSLDSFTTGKQIHGAQAQYRAVGQNRTGTANVGTFTPNKFGLYDTHGNAAEMIRNCWNTSETPTAVTTGECSSRTVKGGSWASTAGHLHFAARAPIGIADAENTVGFRVVRHREK